MCPHKIPNQNLHSTLIKYKGEREKGATEYGIIYIPL